MTQLSTPTSSQPVVTVFFRPMFAISAQPATGISVQVQASAVSRPIRTN
ncbi:MAG: hypothetical protein QM723_29420 [Myxococcaceae bacterium]